MRNRSMAAVPGTSQGWGCAECGVFAWGESATGEDCSVDANRGPTRFTSKKKQAALTALVCILTLVVYRETPKVVNSWVAAVGASGWRRGGVILFFFFVYTPSSTPCAFFHLLALKYRCRQRCAFGRSFCAPLYSTQTSRSTRFSTFARCGTVLHGATWRFFPGGDE